MDAYITDAISSESFDAKVENGRVVVTPKENLSEGTHTETIIVTTLDKATHNVEVSLTVVKIPQAAPAAAPELSSRTTASIVLKTVGNNENGAAVEYRVDGGAWQLSPVFNGLSSDTSYSFEMRYAEIGNYAASPAGPAVTILSLIHI